MYTINRCNNCCKHPQRITRNGFGKKELIEVVYDLYYKGVLLSAPETITEVDGMKRLWIHECIRVFLDRLVEMEERIWFLGQLRDACAEHLHVPFHILLSSLDENGDGDVSILTRINQR